MDALEAIEKLARQAREEKIPAFDVTNRVLQRIRSEKTETLSFVIFDLFAGASAVAASVVCYFSVAGWKFITSPLMQFFAPLQETKLW
jgi:hypothetical protein